jgi:TetR/AcrR family transcriptional regulator
MLEQPGSERVTTASLAAKLQVSEAALYRHFASKAQMFEGLIDFIESSLFTLIDEITGQGGDGADQARRIVTVVLQFGEKNPGMTRVMVGDALVFEHERLLVRMNQFFDRIEAALRQALKAHVAPDGASGQVADANTRASVIVAFAVGRLQRYARSGFKRSPVENLEVALQLLTA